MPMVAVPSGRARLGTDTGQAAVLARRFKVHASWFELESPARTVWMRGFELGRHPVTNAQFAAYLLETGSDHPYRRDIVKRAETQPAHPVTRVSSQDAADFAHWAGCRLPTEAEWEYAARGAEGHFFPWGDEWDPEACRNNKRRDLGREGAGPVHEHDHVGSPFGHKGLAGNILEWTSTPMGSMCNVAKGGFWHQESPFMFRGACRTLSQYRTNRLAYIGFRCARDLAPDESQEAL